MTSTAGDREIMLFQGTAQTPGPGARPIEATTPDSSVLCHRCDDAGPTTTSSAMFSQTSLQLTTPGPPGRSAAILAFYYAVFYFTGVSVKSLMATPYCGGWLRQNRRVFSPSSRVSVIGSESCRFPTVKGISMAVSESASFTETLSR